MPYLPIDPNEKTTATPGGVTSQPVGQPAPQTGVAAAGTGGGSGGKGAGGAATAADPKTGGNYTNLTDYLQANAGNNANVDAVTKATLTPGGGRDPNAVDDAVKRAGQGPSGTYSLLQQTYGNTWGGGAGAGKASLDSALSNPGIYRNSQHLSAQDRTANPAAWTPPVSEAQAPNSTASVDQSGVTAAVPKYSATPPGFDVAAANAGDVGSVSHDFGGQKDAPVPAMPPHFDIAAANAGDVGSVAHDFSDQRGHTASAPPGFDAAAANAGDIGSAAKPAGWAIKGADQAGSASTPNYPTGDYIQAHAGQATPNPAIQPGLTEAAYQREESSPMAAWLAANKRGGGNYAQGGEIPYGKLMRTVGCGKK